MQLANKTGVATTRAQRAAPAARRPVVVRAASTQSAPKQGPIILNGQVAHSLTAKGFDVIKSMDKYLETEVAPLLKPVDKCWQPSDLLPVSSDPDFEEQVRDLRKRAANLPDEYLVVFVGDMITEEALPTYMTMINTLDGVRDETGASQTPWAKWTRAWTAEENRHGDVMNKYMYLTGRVNMKSVELTTQNLISSGMDPKTENNPYLGFTYTSFQERATKVSHGNTARHAGEYGDKILAKMCGLIASDEGRHEIAYQRIVDGFFERDPDGAMMAFGDMMRKQITMPAHLMDDGTHEKVNGPGKNLFVDFSEVAQRTGSYTAFDYADIVDYLNERWVIKDRNFVSGEAAAAQDYVLKVPDRIRKLAERTAARKKPGVMSKFSWVFDKPVLLH